MKAFVLAAGLGTRLGQITKNTPKCLVSAGGKTILQHVLEKLKIAGINDVVINLHYLGDHIFQYLKNNNSFGMNIQFSWEETLLGTGGGLKEALKFYNSDESIIIHNSDVYTDFSLEKLIKFHENHGSDTCATLAVMERESSKKFLFNLNGELCGHENLSDGTCTVFGKDEDLNAYAFSCVQIITPKLYPYILSKDSPFSSVESYLDAAKNGEKIFSYIVNKDNYWIDMGTPAKLKELQLFLSPRNELI